MPSIISMIYWENKRDIGDLSVTVTGYQLPTYILQMRFLRLSLKRSIIILALHADNENVYYLLEPEGEKASIRV